MAKWTMTTKYYVLSVIGASLASAETCSAAEADPDSCRLDLRQVCVSVSKAISDVSFGAVTYSCDALLCLYAPAMLCF